MKGFGNMGNMGGMLKKVQQMQTQMAKTQEELAQRVFEGTAGGGAVTVAMTGGHVVQSVTIDKELIDPDEKEMLESTLTAAINEAIKNIQETTQQEMQKVTGGAGLPNIPGLF